MQLLYRICAALAVLFLFGYLAYTMYRFDELSGRQYRIVMLIASFMVGIFGKLVAAIITAVTGLVAGIFVALNKDDYDSEEDRIIPTRHL